MTLEPQAYETETLQLQDVTQFEEEDQAVASARVASTVRWKLAKDIAHVSDFTYKVWSTCLPPLGLMVRISNMASGHAIQCQSCAVVRQFILNCNWVRNLRSEHPSGGE